MKNFLKNTFVIILSISTIYAAAVVNTTVPSYDKTSDVSDILPLSDDPIHDIKLE